MNTMCSMISVMVCSVPHVKPFFSHLTVFRVGHSRLARLYVRLRSGQLIHFLRDEYSEKSSIRLMTHSLKT
jgi:hypothetical protein